MEERIRANAEMVIQNLRPLSGIDFGYTQESVEWLEGYIERLRLAGEFESAESRDKLISVFGSFLGESIVRCHGGRWAQNEGMWCVAFDDQNIAYPFSKITKQIDNGLEDGIATFFNAIPAIFEDIERAAPSTPKKPWWKVWS
jgi:hypothetical protein